MDEGSVELYSRNGVSVLQEIPHVFRDGILAGVNGKKIFTGVLEIELRVSDDSYLHITSSTVSYIPSSREIVEKVREIINRYKDGEAILDEIIKGKLVEQGKGNYWEYFKLAGVPVIPGSSLKGAVRSRLELLFKPVEKLTPACFTRESLGISEPVEGTPGWRYKKIWWDSIKEYRDRPCNATNWEYYEDIKVCRICDIFGAPGLASRVHFSTLYPSDTNCTEYLDVILSCSKNIHVMVEAVKPSTVFKGEILVNGLELVELGLLATGLKLYSGRELLIGRLKYKQVVRCLGNEPIIMKFGRVRANVVSFRLPIILRELLDSLNIGYTVTQGSLVVEGSELEKLLRQAIEAAYNTYSQYIPRDFDEIGVLEKIWDEERDKFKQCSCG